MHRPVHVLVATSLALTCCAGTALGAGYPPPGRPGGSGKVAKPKGKHRVLHVRGKGKRHYRTIQRAVQAARKGDVIRVPNGTYHEGVRINGRKKSYIKLIGNRRKPSKVVLQGKGLKGLPAQNGVSINGADEVTVRGMTARNYRGNGFFVRSAYGYTFDRLEAYATGTYGIYAFDSIGGTMKRSVAAWNNDSGFYIGQTPPQRKPVRSIVDRVAAYGNVIGYSGTNSRYVTIKRSKWFNNGLGIVPNTLKSEKYPPQEDNVITDNDVFWNNFDYFRGAPFKLRQSSTGFAYPIGTGILVYGGNDTAITGNRVFGNYLMGIGGASQFELALDDDATWHKYAPLTGLRVTGNTMTAGGTDKNGVDVYMDGSGSGNCASGNPGATTSETRAGYVVPACPFTGANGGDPRTAAAQSKALSWVTDDTHEKYWVRVAHSAQSFRGDPVSPLEEFKDYAGDDAPPGLPCIVSQQPKKKGDPVPTRPC